MRSPLVHFRRMDDPCNHLLVRKLADFMRTLEATGCGVYLVFACFAQEMSV